MEEDIDIYADLSTSPEKSSEKCKKCSESELSILDLTKNLEDLKKIITNLEVNFSSLLLTAKGEVSRKDRMIAELRRQVDDASFRRGIFKRHKNYKSNFVNSGSNGVTFAYDGVIFDPTVPPPFSQDFKTVVEPPLPEDFKTYVSPPLPTENVETNIPPPPPPENFNIEKVSLALPETVDTSEYSCNSEPYFEEEEDTEQKYQPEKIVDTIYSKRLRKKLEDEKAQRKIFEKEISREAEKVLEEEKEQKAILNEEAEKKEKERLPLIEETAKNLKSPVSETARESSSKCNLDNKENLSCSNQLNTKSEFLVSQSKVPSLNEEDSSRNRPVLINKLATKRSHENYDEEVDTKRPKMESLKGYDDFREDWSVSGTEPVKVNQESESLQLHSNKKDNLEKLNGFREEEQRDKKIDEKEDARHSYLASRLYLLAEKPVLSNKERRRDLDRRKENVRLTSRDRNKYEKDWYEKDKYMDNYEKERNEKDKYKEKLEKERFERDKYKYRLENERYERDKYDNHKFEKERFRNEKYDRYKRERDKYEKDMYEREKFEKNKLNRKTFRRPESLSPERLNHNRQKDFRNNAFKDNFVKRNTRNARSKNKNLREEFHRPNEQESKFILESFTSRREKELTKGFAPSGRSKSCGNYQDRRERELLKCSSNSERSRSNSKDKDDRVDPNKKISLESYRARREQKLLKINSSERSRSNSKDKDQIIEESRYNHNVGLEKEFSNYNSGRSKNSRSTSNDKDCRREYSKDSKTCIRQSRNRDNVKVGLELKPPDILKKSRDLEEGEISDSSCNSIPPLRIDENGERKESMVTKASGTLDTLKTKIEDLGDSAPLDKGKVKNLKINQKLIEALPKPKKEVKTKPAKRQIQKIKQEIPETKPKVKKSEEKPTKKIIIVVKRKRPIVLSDSNASTTIVSSKNGIMNIKLNNSGDKNLLS